MRTTVTIDPDVQVLLRKAMRERGEPFKKVLNAAVRAGLAAGQSGARPKRYRVKPASLGGVMPGVNLDKALALAAALEDEEIARKLSLRK